MNTNPPGAEKPFTVPEFKTANRQSSAGREE
jgi:hypothetical protein